MQFAVLLSNLQLITGGGYKVQEGSHYKLQKGSLYKVDFEKNKVPSHARYNVSDTLPLNVTLVKSACTL